MFLSKLSLSAPHLFDLHDYGHGYIGYNSLSEVKTLLEIFLGRISYFLFFCECMKAYVIEIDLVKIFLSMNKIRIQYSNRTWIKTATVHIYLHVEKSCQCHIISLDILACGI